MQKRARFIFCLLSLLLLYGQVAVWAQTPCGSCTPSACSTVKMTVTVPGQQPVTTTLAWITNLNVLTAMSNAMIMGGGFSFATVSYCPWGAYVTSIKGYTAPSGSYWQLSVNGRPTNYGPSTQPLWPGDSFSWSVVRYSSLEADKTASQSHQHLLYQAHLKATSKPK